MQRLIEQLKLNPNLVVFSAGTVFLGCSILLVCGVVTLVAINLLNPAPARRTPTPQPTAQAVAGTATARPSLTPLPPLTPNRPPTTLPTAALPPVIGLADDPAQAVRDYYALVSQGRYDESWPLLSDAFKQTFNCCAPNYNYDGYRAWWDSVDFVDFGQVRTVSQSGGRAVVYAELRYHMHAGGVSEDREPYIILVYDPARGQWLFDDKGLTSSGQRGG